jgi:dihydrofolate reductase
MRKSKIALIACVDRGLGIGKEGELLYYIKSDLKHFRETTENNIVVMGRKTWESIKNRPLPNRINVVLTREELTDDDIDNKYKGAMVFNDINVALSACNKYHSNKTIFIIGGGSLYEQTIDLADILYITEIDECDSEADTFFPDYHNSQVWERHKLFDGLELGHCVEFIKYTRKEK